MIGSIKKDPLPEKWHRGSFFIYRTDCVRSCSVIPFLAPPRESNQRKKYLKVLVKSHFLFYGEQIHPFLKVVLGLVSYVFEFGWYSFVYSISKLSAYLLNIQNRFWITDTKQTKISRLHHQRSSVWRHDFSCCYKVVFPAWWWEIRLYRNSQKASAQ